MSFASDGGSDRGHAVSRVAVVTDISIDLSPQQAAELGVILAPISYELAGQRFQSGEQSAQEFFAALDAGATATLSGVDPGAFEQAFREAAQDHDELVCICQSFGSSFTYVAAQVAALKVSEEAETPIRIINSGRSTAAQAAITVAASRAASSAESADEVLRVVEAVAPQAETFAVAASLDQLERSGQLQAVASQSGIGSLDDGVPVFRVRDRLRALLLADDAIEGERALLERAEQAAGGAPVTLVVTHAGVPEAAERLRSAAEQRLKVSEAFVTAMGPTLGSLLGAGAYGLGFAAAQAG